MSELPYGWHPVRLGDVLTLVNGRAYKKQEMLNNGTPILRIQNLNNGQNWFYSDLELPVEKYATDGDLLYSWSATFGPYWCTWEKVIFHYHIWKVVPTELINKRFAYYELLRITEDIRNAAHGVAMPHMTKERMENWEIILPPISEQIRIADLLDDLLSKIHSLTDRLNNLPILLKKFRQSVLTAAASGQLSDNWGDRSKKEWSYERAGDVCEKVQSGGTPKEGFAESGIPFLKVYNIVNQKVDFQYRPQYISEQIHTGPSAKSIAKPGDVLMNIVGPPLGKIATIPDFAPEWNINQAITLFRPNSRIIGDWISIVLEGGDSLQSILSETKGSAGQVNISLSQCRNFMFPIPPIYEQTEIAQRVDKLLKFAERLLKKSEQAKNLLAKTYNSLLIQAANGELTAKWRSTTTLTPWDASTFRDQVTAAKLKGKPRTRQADKNESHPKQKVRPQMSRSTSGIIKALESSETPLSGQELMKAAGYPNDSTTELLESFFLELREALRDKKIQKLPRDNDKQDWFSLVN
ncbi:restriction endonuclease subunit S [Pseudomonas fluorescens]|uniref:restriction endonuclease subunit S n=1 Tax=Pseudomonas fluorescens TaxID=294 RepID=UPI00069ABE95|nr:restriction endonuclease subunit S [Pseudomonas fluorescens]